MKKILFLIAFIISSFSLSAQNLSVAAKPNEILRAMHDELNRSMSDLKLESLERPYFIEYTLTITDKFNANAKLGNLTEKHNRKIAELSVKVRVGSYERDNSNFMDLSSLFSGGMIDISSLGNQVPIDMNYKVLRRELWLATDAAYKSAAETYSKKLASLKNIIQKDTIPDFAKAKPFKGVDTIIIEKIDFDKITNEILETSAIFRNYPQIYSSNVSFEFIPVRTYYVNSEGTEYIKDEFFTGFEAVAYMQAEKGTPVVEHYNAYARFPKDLPSLDSLKKGVDAIAKNMMRLASAPTLEESYNGPVLVEGQAACEVFAQVFVPNLIAQREQSSEGRFSFGGSDKTNLFQKKIGGRVLPEFLSVKDDPSLNTFQGVPLLGYYKIDDEGVPAQTVNLVVNGYLKTLLNNRTPIKRVLESNGHARDGSIMISNLFITSTQDKAMPQKDLKKKFLDLVKQRELPYGIIIRKVIDKNILSTSLSKITFGNTSYFIKQNAIPLLQAYKVYPDGKEELLKNIEINSLTAQSFKDIINVGNKSYILNYLAPTVLQSFSFGSAGYIGSSIIAPDLLFEDMEINSNDKDTPKLPFLAPPVVNK
ncbi:MAG TPA: metallopeptidase TldD-related protein [Bacteroidota bacterium]|nr:metallopeptidase TldD-related protein [Candidatus Kapabacteria bacterium]HRS01863.1 metallopeptidase TldD-related protein [Bacteroidota bacterium]